MKYATLLAIVLTVSAVALAGVNAGATQNTVNCVDGSDRKNLISTWSGHDTISVKTKSGQPVCKDVVLYFSSYMLPDNYDGGTFTGNPTATPQQLFDSERFVIAKGQSQSATVTIDVPDTCEKHAQVDVYLAPEVKIVGEKGHDGQGIKGTNGNNHIIPRDTTDCEVPEEPVETAVEEEVPEVLGAGSITELPKTGVNSTLGMGLVLSVLTAGLAYVVRR